MTGLGSLDRFTLAEVTAIPVRGNSLVAVASFVIGFPPGGLVEDETYFWSVSRYIATWCQRIERLHRRQGQVRRYEMTPRTRPCPTWLH